MKEKFSDVDAEARAHGEVQATRVTVVLNEGLNFALEVLEYKTRTPKNKFIRDALRTRLKKEGIDPSTLPKFIKRVK